MSFLQTAHGARTRSWDDVSGVQQVYNGHVTGYAGRFTEQVVEQIRRMPEGRIRREGPDCAHPGHAEVGPMGESRHTWTIAQPLTRLQGLARISHRPKLTFSTFTKYVYDPQGGEGVDVYVIDTGINVDHVEFEGRAFWGKDRPLTMMLMMMVMGHGTHCAGTIASRAIRCCQERQCRRCKGPWLQRKRKHV